MRRQNRSLWQRYAFAGGPRILAIGDALVVGALSIAAFAYAEPSASAPTAQPRELVELRTEHSRTLDNGDGTRRRPPPCCRCISAPTMGGCVRSPPGSLRTARRR